MTSKFMYLDVLPGSHIYKYKNSPKISPWISEVHLKVNMSKTKFFLLSFKPVSCAAFCIYFFSGNSVLLAAQGKILGGPP